MADEEGPDAPSGHDARDHDDDDPDRGREHIEVLRETIDRNRNRDWESYREQYRFTVVDDGRVRLSPIGTEPAAGRAVETEVDHVVDIEGGVAVDCNCFVARRRFDRKRCRHMRAVDAHPYI